MADGPSKLDQYLAEPFGCGYNAYFAYGVPDNNPPGLRGWYDDDNGMEDSIRNPDTLLSCMGSITDSFFRLSLGDTYDIGSGLGVKISGNAFAGMPQPQISLQQTVFGLSSGKDETPRKSQVVQTCSPGEESVRNKPGVETYSDLTEAAPNSNVEVAIHGEGMAEAKLEPPGSISPATKKETRTPNIKSEHDMLDIDGLPWHPPGDGSSDETPATTSTKGKKRLKKSQGLAHLPESLSMNGPPDAGPGNFPIGKPKPKLACPYLKHDPDTYGQRPSCRGPSFATTHRLKEHLYRTHRQKPNCPRCRSVFSTEDEVASHVLLKGSCEVSLDVTVEGFNASQKEKLQSKRRGWAKSEEDKWIDIFQILFPDCEEIPEPYYHPNFNDVAPGLASAHHEHQLDFESIFTRDVPPELEQEAFEKLEEVIGSQLDRRKRRKVVHVFQTYAVKVLQQPRIAKDTTSGKASAESRETEFMTDERKAESHTTPSSSSSPPAAQALCSTAALGKSQGVEARSITNETMLDTHVVKDNSWSPLDLGDFNFGDDPDLQCWPEWNRGFVDGEGYDWTTLDAFELPAPCWNHSFDYAAAQGDNDSAVNIDVGARPAKRTADAARI